MVRWRHEIKIDVRKYDEDTEFDTIGEIVLKKLVDDPYFAAFEPRYGDLREYAEDPQMFFATQEDVNAFLEDVWNYADANQIWVEILLP
jgi:hypothetical protein